MMTGYPPLSTLLTGVIFFTLGHWVNNFLPLSAVAIGVVCFIVGFNLNKIVNDVEEKKKWNEIVLCNCKKPANVEINENEGEEFLQMEDETEQPRVDVSKDDSMNEFLACGEFRSHLIQILNQTDPVSFVRMASTCRSLRTICLNSREISVRFPCKVVFVKDSDNIVEGIRFKYLKGKQGHLTVYGPMLRNLKKLPFHFEIHAKFRDFLSMEPVDVDEMDNYIKQFHSFSVKKLYVDEEIHDMHCWPQMLTFIQDHGVKRLNSRRYYIDREVLKSILMIKFDKLKLATEIPRGMLCKIGSRVVESENSDVTVEDLAELVQTMARDDIANIDDWNFHHLNDNLCKAEPFIACFKEFKKIPFSHKGSLPADRPLVAFRGFSESFMLTGQHKVYGFSHHPTIKIIHVFAVDGSPFRECPRAFLPFSQ